VEVTLFGSDELDRLREIAEYTVVRDRLAQTHDLHVAMMLAQEPTVRSSESKRIGPKKLHREAGRELTAEWARRIIKSAVRANILRLLDLHRAYDNGEVRTPPPALTLENILGFDLTFTVSYDGRRLLKSKDPFARLVERKQMEDRLVGWLLLNIANEEGCDAPQPIGGESRIRGLYYALIPHLESSGLLTHDDVERIRRGAIVKVAFEHLKDAKALKLFRDDPLNRDLVSELSKNARGRKYLESIDQKELRGVTREIEHRVERCRKCGTPLIAALVTADGRCRACKTPRRR
jgi:hypothetical protein